MKRRLRLVLVTFFCALLYYSGMIGLWRILFPLKRVCILYFHQIGRRQFETCIRFLTKHYRIIALDELITRLQTGQPLPTNTVVLTFDDGYLSNFEENLPVLRQYEIPCTGYLTAGYIGAARDFWWDQLAAALRGSRQAETALAGRTYPLRTAVQREKALAAGLRWLKALPESQKQNTLDDLIARLGYQPGTLPRSNPLMNWDQVRQMAAAGVVLGGHTLDHSILSRVDGAEKKRQIEGCKQHIERETGQSVRHFAYPNGRREDFDADCRRLLEQSGYHSAVTTQIGTAGPESDRFALPRKPMTERVSVPILALTLSGIMGGIEFER